MVSLTTIGFLVMVAITLLGLAWEQHRKQKERLFLSEGGAFEEKIRTNPFDHEQLERLKDKISSVGALAIENQAQGRNDPVGSWTHVFVIDVNGAIHDVVRTPDVRYATRIAHTLVRAWEIPLDDHGGVLLAPEDVGLEPARPRRRESSGPEDGHV